MEVQTQTLLRCVLFRTDVIVIVRCHYAKIEHHKSPEPAKADEGRAHLHLIKPIREVKKKSKPLHWENGEQI